MNGGFSNPYIDLTDTQKDVLVGSMLGDGNLRLESNNRCKNARLTINRALKDWKYLLWEQELFEDFCSTAGLNLSYSEKDIIQPYDSIGFQTLSNPVFTEHYHKWYQDIKIVPRDLALNSLIMLIWFLDDGCITRASSGRFHLKFATNGFRKEDTMFLRNLLQYRYDDHFEIYKTTKEQYIIQAYGDVVDTFISDVDSIYPYHLMSRKAIWKHPYQHKIHTYDLKEIKIKEFLQGKEVFYTNELGRYAGFIFARIRNHKETVEVATGNLNHYLRAYIEDGTIYELPKDQYHLGTKYGISKAGQQHFLSNHISQEIETFNTKIGTST